jgi:ABC-type nitrate/sulfonate/bicarbonate transport system substrate-binding protein
MRLRSVAAVLAGTALLLAACADDGDEGSSPPPTPDDTVTATTEPGDTGTTDGGSPGVTPVTAGEPFPDDRCAANRAAGTITYLTGFDFAATASIVDILVADEKGYYDELCLDVEVKASFSTANYPLIAENDAQFASGGSFSEVVQFAEVNDADLVVVAVEGPTAIDSLIVKPGNATELGDLAGTTIGVKGKLPPSIAAMLAQAGLTEGDDFDTVLLDGFNPLQHIEIGPIVGFPGYKSNEPGALERAGIDFDLFDPLDYDIPGSFGIVYTNQQFLDQHPSAAEDFMRATMRGLADAIADPEAAAAISVNRINATGNPRFLSPEGETFRWATDAALIASLTPEGVGFGVPRPDALQNELDVYAEIGLFGDAGAPDAVDALGELLLVGLYDGSELIWPG